MSSDSIPKEEPEQVVQAEGNDTKPQNPNEALAKGLEQFLKPIVLECDVRIKEVFASQIHLSNQINQLNEGLSFYLHSSLYLTFCNTELSKFSEISKIPALNPYIQKLSNARGRVNNVNLLLDRISQRLARIHEATKDTS